MPRGTQCGYYARRQCDPPVTARQFFRQVPNLILRRRPCNKTFQCWPTPTIYHQSTALAHACFFPFTALKKRQNISQPKTPDRSGVTASVMMLGILLGIVEQYLAKSRRADAIPILPCSSASSASKSAVFPASRCATSSLCSPGKALCCCSVPVFGPAELDSVFPAVLCWLGREGVPKTGICTDGE
jgi:hypothetical protein